MFSAAQSLDEQVPFWTTRSGRAELERPSAFLRDAQKFLSEHSASSGRTGFLVRNAFGKVMPMSALVAARMWEHFAEGRLQIHDYYKNHYLDQASAAMSGFDTEGVEAVQRWMK